MVFTTRSSQGGYLYKFYRDKEGPPQITEDNYATSPNAAIVADGVGGALFSSYYIATILTQNALFKYQNSLPEVDISERNLAKKIGSIIDECLEEYREFFYNKVTKMF